MNFLHNFILLLKFPTVTFIFIMLVERQFIPTPTKWKSESSEQLCKNNTDLNNFRSKVVGYMSSFLSKSLWNDCHTTVLTGAMVKPSKDNKYVLVELNSFIKPLRQWKGGLVIIYIQEHISEIEEIKKRFNVTMVIVCDILHMWDILSQETRN